MHADIQSPNPTTDAPGVACGDLVLPVVAGQKIRFEGKMVEVSAVSDGWVTYWTTKGRKVLSNTGASLDDWNRLVSRALSKGAKYQPRKNSMLSGPKSVDNKVGG